MHCPGCGSLRAVHHLLHGDVVAAFKLNPLMVASLPVLLALAVFPRIAFHPWTSKSALVMLVAYAILRNIPHWPWSCLAPH
jgi:hypothetical protein